MFCAHSGQRLNAPHPGRGGPIAQQDESADISSLAHMGAAAKLQAVGVLPRSFARAGQMPHRNHPNLIAIFFAKERLGPQGARISRCHNASLNRAVLPDEGVYFALHLLQLRGRKRLPMAEVKPQAVICVQ